MDAIGNLLWTRLGARSSRHRCRARPSPLPCPGVRPWRHGQRRVRLPRYRDRCCRNPQRRRRRAFGCQERWRGRLCFTPRRRRSWLALLARGRCRLPPRLSGRWAAARYRSHGGDNVRRQGDGGLLCRYLRISFSRLPRNLGGGVGCKPCMTLAQGRLWPWVSERAAALPAAAAAELLAEQQSAAVAGGRARGTATWRCSGAAGAAHPTSELEARMAAGAAVPELQTDTAAAGSESQGRTVLLRRDSRWRRFGLASGELESCPRSHSRTRHTGSKESDTWRRPWGIG